MIRIVYLNSEKRNPLTNTKYKGHTYGIDVLQSSLSKDQQNLVKLVCRKFQGSEEKDLYNEAERKVLKEFFASLKEKGIKSAITLEEEFLKNNDESKIQ